MQRGSIVQGLDGQNLGRVEEVAASSFALRMAGGQRRWVRRDAIYTNNDSVVTLICYANGLERWLAG